MAVVRSKKKGQVIVNESLCKGCNICVEFCPHKSLGLNNLGKACHANDTCNACGLCELYCPDFAIKVEEIGS